MEEDTNRIQLLTNLLTQKLGPEQQKYKDFFKPEVKLCLAVGNYDYSIVRDNLGKGFGDLPAA